MASEGGKPKKKLKGSTISAILKPGQRERLDRLVEASTDHGVMNLNQLIRLVADEMQPSDVRRLVERRDS